MKNRGVAILLTFFLGGFGVHKFYLGDNIIGLLYFFFCWTFIPSLLSIFDFIGLILMSEQNFNIQYNNIIRPEYQPRFSLPSTPDNITMLKKLKNLYDDGIITAEEYEEKRRKYLDSI